jgi:hypothetical protein
MGTGIYKKINSVESRCARNLKILTVFYPRKAEDQFSKKFHNKKQKTV